MELSYEVGTGFEPVYTDLQSVASPLGQPTVGWVHRDPLRADDEARTRDLNLGKVALYQLSYVRLPPSGGFPSLEVRQNLSRWSAAYKLGGPLGRVARVKGCVGACVGERQAPGGPDWAGGGGERPRSDGRRRGVRGSQGSEGPAVRAGQAPG